MKAALIVLCAVVIGALALPTPILEPRFQAGAPVTDKRALAAQAQDRAAKLTSAANKLPAASSKRTRLLKKAEKAQMDFEQYTAEAATDDLVPKPQVVGFGADRLPDAQVPGEVPKTLLTNQEVDTVARNVLAAARRNVCNKKGEYCDLRLTGEFKKGPTGDSNNMAKWKQEYLAKQKAKKGKKGKGKKGKGKGKKKGRKGRKGRKGAKGKKKATKKAKAKAKKDAKKGKKDAKKGKKDAKKAKKLEKKGAVKAAAEMKKASKLRKKAATDLKKAAKANKKGNKKKAKKLEKKAKKEEKQAKKQEKKAKKDAKKIPKTKEECVKQKGKWDDKAKKCAPKKK